MRQQPEHFGDQELVLIYIAKRLKDALALEDVFTDQQLDYLVEPDRYTGGLIFRSERVGAFFYVTPQDEAAACQLMLERGYKPYIPVGKTTGA